MSEFTSSSQHEERRDEKPSRGRDTSSLSSRQDEESEHCVEILEEGLLSFMSSIIQQLSLVNKMENDSKFINPRHKLTGSGFGHSGINSDLGAENHVYALGVILHDPLSDFKTVEKEDLEEQKRNEEKIQQKDASKPENANEEGGNNAGTLFVYEGNQNKPSPNKATSEKDHKADQNAKDQPNQKKKKAVFDDYAEIYKILLKNKQEKLKDNESKDKNTEDQFKTIQKFAQEADMVSQKVGTDLSSIRRDTHNEKKHYPSNNITLMHLVHFFERSHKYKNSKYHFKAMMLL